MTGTWVGYYKYNKEYMQKSMGADKTNFTIIIHSFDGKKFNGVVSDEITSGGMEGEGKIFGIIDSNRVRFQKLMPKNTLIFKSGERITTDRKHPTLYYSGTISPNETHMEGTWKFKWKIDFLFGIIPIPYKPGTGTWSMTFTGNL